MSPLFEYSGARIYNADCRTILRDMPSKSFDLVLTDFPYGNKTEYDTYDDTQENLKQLVADTMPEILRVGKRALITCGVANIHLFPRPKWILAWFAPAGTGSGPWGFCTWQPILAYGKDPYLSAGLGRRADSRYKIEQSKKDLGNKELGEAHPCPKPLDFWTWLLLRGSVDKNDLILDPFMGAGTTLIASRNTGREATGIEISEKYCKAAMEWYQRQMPLMTP